MKKLICSLLLPMSLFSQGQDLPDLSNDSDLQTNNSNIPTAIELPQGWSMFGYTCIDSIDAIIGFTEIADKIEIVKDEWGMSYIPLWEFNALGSLQFSEGYQINMTHEVIDFQFCDAIIPEDGITQSDVDSAYANGLASVTPEDGVTQADVDAAHAMYIGWCESDFDNDGICDVDEVSGCMDTSYCNYNLEAEFDDGSCYDNDLGCGCDNPAAQEGYDCDGNIIQQYQIGDLAHGGIIFYIDETGQHGLVAASEDLGNFYWGCTNDLLGIDETDIGSGLQNTLNIVAGCSERPIAADEALAYESSGFSDWYLPSLDELSEMHNTIGQWGPEGNINGFSSGGYWSSSEQETQRAYTVVFADGRISSPFKIRAYQVRVIRAF